MNLFNDTRPDDAAPLAARMRPRVLDAVVGQEHLCAPDSIFRKAFDSDRLPSIILHGPAGTGKSSLARIVAAHTSHHFIELSAVSAGVSHMRQAAEDAKEQLSLYDRRTIVFIDEIHRLNKAQQDQLLPHVENGTFTLIGATTENPYFSVISPLLSRCRLFELRQLSAEHLKLLVARAAQDEQRGLGKLRVAIDPEALEHLAQGAGGDARAALNALELAVLTAVPGADGVRRISVADAEAALQRPVLKYDRAGDEHYDTISAFIKSMRGSDPDAAIYWLAKMLEAGEDPGFIARRLIIQAAEDVGLADPTALRVAIAAADAVEYVGLPEAQIPLAMAAIHVSVAPKSNSAYLAIASAREDVQKQVRSRVPGHLAGGMRPGDARSDYLYPHNYPGGWVQQDYLPAQLSGRRYYEPKDNPRERKIAAYLDQLRQAQTGGGTDQPTEGSGNGSAKDE